MNSKYKKITRRKSSKRTTRKSRINKSKNSKTHKRSQHKRSQHKRSQHKRSQHKRSQHKRSQHKRSQHKRSQHKRSQHKRSQHKRSQHKRSQHKRSQHKRSQHKRSQHKRSQHKRSQHKRSQHKRSQHKRSHRKYKGGCGGQAWNGGDIGKWPGVSGPHDGNYYEYKGSPSGLYDPPMPSNKQFQNGGGMINLLPQDLVNFGRSLTGGLQGAYAGYQGEPRFDSTYPLPIDQPSMNRDIQTQIKYKPLNLDKIHTDSGNSVVDI